MRTIATLGQKHSELVGEFVRSLGVLSPARVRKYHYKLGKIFRLIGDPESITKNELMDFISEINTGDLADSTKRDYRLIKGNSLVGFIILNLFHGSK